MVARIRAWAHACVRACVRSLWRVWWEHSSPPPQPRTHSATARACTRMQVFKPPETAKAEFKIQKVRQRSSSSSGSSSSSSSRNAPSPSACSPPSSNPRAQGAGQKLRDIPNVQHRLSKLKADDDLLQSLHNAFYKRPGKATTRKRDVLEFSGFVFEGDEVSAYGLFVAVPADCVRQHAYVRRMLSTLAS